MKKRLMTLILAAALVLSVTACGGKKNEEVQDNTAAETQEAVEDTAVEETVEENEGAAEDNAADAVTGDTLGQTLLAVFNAETAANEQATAQELADKILGDAAIKFSGATMPVEAGLLTGFGNAEITGFSEGVAFMPVIGTIPFVGYVFTLEEGTDAAAFMQTLTDNADPRWNICTEAEETVVENAGDKVFFLMCPKALEE